MAETIPHFDGTIVTHEHSDYDALRAVWNRLHDRRPALIARCRSAADVAAAIAYARRRDLRVAVRCGGHSLPGHSTVDDGLVIDLRPMQAISVDAEALTVRVQGGALLGDVDSAAQAHELVVPVGVVSHTGVGGLTLGGGVGRMMRRFGLTIDALLEAEVVLADGRVVRASEMQEPELFWALRGGGGNFGVVTEFLFRAHRLSGLVVLAAVQPLADAAHVLGAARARMADPATPDELLWTSFLRKPPAIAPFVPDALRGEPGVMSLIEWSGEPAAGRALLEQVRDDIEPAGSTIDDVPYLAMQTAGDALLAPGTLHAYVKAGFADDLSDALIAALRQRAAAIESEMSVIELLSLGGAIDRTAREATAFPHRGKRWLVNIPAQWQLPSETDREIAWCRETYAAAAPSLTGGAYSNFMEGDEGDALGTAYGAMQARLAEAKAAYDPDNVFSLNQNIAPAVPA